MTTSETNTKAVELTLSMFALLPETIRFEQFKAKDPAAVVTAAAKQMLDFIGNIK